MNNNKSQVQGFCETYNPVKQEERRIDPLKRLKFDFMAELAHVENSLNLLSIDKEVLRSFVAGKRDALRKAIETINTQSFVKSYPVNKKGKV